MRITISNGSATMDRGNSREDRAAAAAFIKRNVRCRYTPQSKARAKAYAKEQAA